MNQSRLEIILDLPAKILSPNAPHGKHWGPKSRAIKSQRQAAGWATLAAMREAKIKGPWKSATVQATAVFTKKRVRDESNFNASLKSALDGIADAKLVANDTDLTLLPAILVTDPNGEPYLKLVVTELTTTGAKE
jgi:hypothetical protein